MMLILKNFTTLISKTNHFPTKPHKEVVCVFPTLAFVRGHKSSSQKPVDQINYKCASRDRYLCFARCHIAICDGTHTHKTKTVCFNFFYHAPQESCLFCAHCHIPPGDFETVARQDGPVFGLTSQSSTGGSHRLDRGGCLPDRWSSGFRNYGASEDLWTLSSTICWYMFHMTATFAHFSQPCNKCSGRILFSAAIFSQNLTEQLL